MKKIKTLLNSFVQIGTDKTNDKEEFKRIRLLNIFCISWLVMEMVLMTEDAITKQDPTLQLIIHTGNVLGLFLVMFLQKKGRTTIARIVFFALILYSNFLFCNFAEKGNYIEYFYIMIPALMLLFTDKNSILIPTFIISILLFFIPNRVFEIYPKGTFGSPIIILIQFGFIFYLVKYFKDANKKSEQKLESKKDELQQLNEFQLQFFTNIAHEIRTPLTIINGETDTIANNKELTLTHKSIKKQVTAINTIINDVLDLSKLKDANFELHLQYLNLKELAHNIYINFEPLATQKNIKFSMEFNKDAIVKVDRLYIVRAFNNILSNAIKYTPKKGTITIKALVDKNNVALSVSDTGIGISKQNINFIFNRFYQVNNDINKAGGSGIGLNFSKEIINLHNGTIKVTSTPNQGSVFTVSLPLFNDIKVETTQTTVQKSTQKLYTTPSIKIEDKNTTYTILIVDDSYEMRQYLKSVLTMYTCYEAENGQEALLLLASQKVDVVISDYMMPTMNGLELLKNLKEKKQSLPVIMLTAATNNSYKFDSLRFGVDDYVNKPFEKEELLIRIENVIKNYSTKTTFISEENVTETELSENNQWIDKAKKYVLKEISNTQMTQMDLADYLHISKSSLNRKIKSETGLTPNAFIKEVKLLEAKNIIENNPNILLKTLALEVGFNHASYFSKIYEERFGVKPIVNL